MRKRKQLTIAVGAAILLTAIAFLLPRQQPSFQGLSLETWLSRYRDSRAVNPDSAETAAAAQAVRRIGPDALPWLLNWLPAEQSPRRAALRRLASRIPSPLGESIIAIIENSEVHAGLARAGFDILGSQASNAVPALVDLLLQTNMPNASLRSSMALASIGPPAIPALLKVLTTPHLFNRDLAAYVFANMNSPGTNAEPAVPILLKSLDDPDIDLAEAAALALGQLLLHTNQVVPALASKLTGPASRLKAQAAMSLAAYGQAASSATPLLLRALSDNDPDVRYAATNALSAIAPRAFTNATTK
jgi:hypothetical protein